MRTIEALVLKKKLITTNTNIKYEDFLLPENFLIVDRTQPVIPVAFLPHLTKKLKEILLILIV